MNNLVGQEFMTKGGNLFIVTGVSGRLLTTEVVDGPKAGHTVDVPKEAFMEQLSSGYYTEAREVV